MWEKTRFVLVIATICIVNQSQAEDDKWKWKSSARSIDNRTPALFRPQHDYIQSQRPLPQYEVGEETEGIQPRPISKPNDFRPPKDYIQSQASTALQDDPVDEERFPVNRYPENRPGSFDRYPSNNRPASFPNDRPGFYPGDRPRPYPGDRPRPYPGDRPRPYPGDRPGPYPGDRPGLYPNDRYPLDRYPPNRYPNDRPPRPSNTDRYGIINPVNPIDPINRPYPSQNVGPIDRDPTAILTGPVPSWQREPAIKNYDRCKCSSKLNCNTPGISFGHCDVGKQYCCYNSRGNPLEGGPAPQEPTHSAEQGILVGPGGPTGIIGRPGSRPGRPSFGPQANRGPGANGGALPYPGGPNTQFHSAENGVLIGPGGPFDFPAGRPPQRPYQGQNPYFRSNQKKED